MTEVELKEDDGLEAPSVEEPVASLPPRTVRNPLTSWIAALFGPRQENVVWLLLTSRAARFGVRDRTLYLAFAVWAVSVCMMGSVFRDLLGLVFFFFGTGTLSLYGRSLAMPTQLVKDLRQRNCAEDVFCAPISNPAFVDAYLRYFMFVTAYAAFVLSGMIVIWWLAIVGPHQQYSTRDLKEVFQVIGTGSFVLFSTLWVCYWAYVGRGAMLAGAYGYVVGYILLNMFYIVFVRQSSTTPLDWIHTYEFHLALGFSMLLSGLWMLLICRRTYGDRVRMQLYP